MTLLGSPPAPTPDPATVALAAALARFVDTTSCPRYLEKAATAWLDSAKDPGR